MQILGFLVVYFDAAVVFLLNFSLLFRLALAILSIHSAKMVADTLAKNTPKFIPLMCPIGPKVWDIDGKRLKCASVIRGPRDYWGVHVLLVIFLDWSISLLICNQANLFLSSQKINWSLF
jgi:hypothetical protein